MRWLTNYCSIALAVFINFIFLQEVTANAVFELELKKFVNIYGKDNNGNCCSGFRKSDGKCSKPCVTKFRVCLNVYQEVINPNSHCTFGEKVTPVLGENIVDFSVVKNIANPLEFKLESWQGTFSLIIEAWHEEENGTLYYEPVLVTRIMTQKWLEVGTDWKEDEHKSADHSFQYQYRVICQEHYHGSGCRKWCKPRNDSFGHYTCDSDGNQVCLEGWQGPESYCNKAVCSPGCKGLCKEPNECTCPPGWQGSKCDQCIVYPGCLHGTCEEPWKCNCEEGWGGLFCNQDLNYCTNHKPCKNGATCYNTAPGSYSCECPIGYNGTNCEIVNDSCANSPCRNGGTCLDTDNEGFVCQCKSSFTGRYCELTGQTCADRPCKNNAPCTDTPSGFQCHCPDGFDGATCERSVNDCLSSPCLNGGSCVDEHRGFHCVCPFGYSGDRCEANMDDCSHMPCLHGGKCIDGIGEFKCHCVPGYVGHLCEVNVNDCGTSPCGNGGTCIDGTNDFQCKCRPGWSGRYCNEKVPLPISPCEADPCDNGGVCKEAPELSVGYRCICPVGVLGPRCTVPHRHNVPTPKDRDNEPMSPLQILLIVSFSIAVPLLAIVSAAVIIIMKRRRKKELDRNDEEARRQNEQNAAHNAVNNKNMTKGMIFNSLDYPAKSVNTIAPIHQSTQQLHYQKDPIVVDFVGGSKKNAALENPYSIVPARSTKTLNIDISRHSLASRLEKDLDSYVSRNTPTIGLDPGVNISKNPDPHLSRTQSHSDVYLKRPSSNCGIHDVCVSTHTLTSTCSPSTCTTPSSVYVIEEHVDENYIATEV